MVEMRKEASASATPVAALGRTADLGVLYDIRSEEVLDSIIFTGELPVDATKKPEIGGSFHEVDLTNNVHEKFKNFNVNGNLALSVICGLVDVKGAGSCIQKERTSTTEVQCTYTHRKNLCHEKVYFNNPKVKELLDIKTLVAAAEADKATHVIVGIEWGIAVTVVITYNLKKDEDSRTWNAPFNAKVGKDGSVLDGIKKFLSSHGFPIDGIDLLKLQGEVTVGGEKGINDLSKSLQMSVYSDDPQIGEVDTSPETALEVVKNISKSLAKKTTMNNGKGCQQVFYLKPIDEVIRELDSTIQISRRFTTIKEALANELMKKIDVAHEEFARFRTLKSAVEERQQLLPKILVKEVDEMHSEATSNYERWIEKFAEILKEVRSSTEGDLGELKLSQHYREVLEPTVKKATDFTARPDLNGRLDLLDRLIRNHVESHIGALDELRGNRSGHPCYVLIYNFDRDRDSRLFETTLDHFLELAKQDGQKPELIAVDTSVFELKEKLPRFGEPRIFEFLNEECICDDLLAVLQACTVRINPETKRTLVSIKSPFCSPLFMPCPVFHNGRRCSNEVREWLCADCRSPINYEGSNVGVEPRFNCDCGGWAPAEHFTFHCNSPYHGSNYEAADNLQRDLSIVKPVEEFVVLIVGEEGVDMEAVLNNLALYFTNDNWETIRDGGSILTLLQADSCVSNCKSQSFTFKNGTLRYKFICSSNTGSVIECIGRESAIQLICFVSLPDKPLLSSHFAELIKQLPTSITKNICTVYASTADASALEAELEKIRPRRQEGIPQTSSNQFLLQTSVHRYLSAKKEGKVPLERLFKDEVYYESCFKFSVKEVNRLLQHPMALQPVNGESALNLVLWLAEALPRLSRAILETRINLARLEQDLTTATAAEGIDQLLDTPAKKTRFHLRWADAAFCHKCLWSDDSPNLLPLESLSRQRVSEDDGKFSCNNCSEHFERLDSRVLVQDFTIDDFENPQFRELRGTVKELATQNVSGKVSLDELVQKKLLWLLKKKDELREEAELIRTAAARFARFLERHRSPTSSDPMEAYFGETVEICDADVEFREFCRIMLEEYRDTKSKMEASLHEGKELSTANRLAADAINEIVAKLRRMSNYGDTVRLTLLQMKELTKLQSPPDVFCAKPTVLLR